MSDKVYNITIKALLDLNARTPTSSINNPTTTQESSIRDRDNATKTMSAMAGISYGRQQVNKLVNTFAPQEVSDVASKISKASMYALKGIRAVTTSNPLEIADVTLDILCDIGQQLRQEQQKMASIENSQDIARINSSIYNIEGTIVKTNGFNGRYEFKGR